MFRQHTLSLSIVLFLFLFILVQFAKPNFLYGIDGSIREFGVGYKNKTFLPLWLFAIILAIISYMIVLYATTYNRIHLY